jgi:hypothetical protein
MVMAHHVLVALGGTQSHLVNELQGWFESAILRDVKVEPGTPGQRRGIPLGYVSCKTRSSFCHFSAWEAMQLSLKQIKKLQVTGDCMAAG